eukprot:g2309.t1
MTSPNSKDRKWRRSSIGITPLTVRPRAGQRRVSKFDLTGDNVPGRAAPDVQGQTGRKGSINPLTIAPARRVGGEDGRVEGVVLPPSSTRSSAGFTGRAAGARVCSVCARASADYSCPRCLIGYCSSKCYKAHGSTCTEAFFRGHVERETRLREEEDIERGSSTSSNNSGGGSKGSSGMRPKESRRASMVEVLRRIRHGDRGQTNGGGRGSSSSRNNNSRCGGNGAQPPSVPSGEENRQHAEADSDDGEDGELFIQQERLEALALALKERGHALSAQPAPTDAVDAGPAPAAVGTDVGGTARGDPGGVTTSVAPRAVISGASPPSSDRRRSGDLGRDSDGSVGGTERGKNPRAGGSAAQNQERQVRAPDRGQHQGQVHEELGGGDEGVLDLLTAEERGRFLRDVASGRLGKLIVPWVPWWTQTARVQEVTTMTAGGRTSHSLPPPVVDPCHHTMCSLGAQEDEVSSPPTRPSTPEQQQQSCGSELPRGGSSGRRHGGGSSSSSSSSSSNAGGSTCTRHSFAALLCQPFHGAPDFSTICAKRPSPTLPALAADLVYAYALAARLYNGCWCSDPVGASMALVGASPVLKDGATPATVGQALAACVERAVEGEGASYGDYAESLREDVLLICSDPRKLVCAFQDAWGMLEAAGRTLAHWTKPLRPAANGGVGDGSSGGKGKKAQRRAAKELGKVEKRIGYFLLWARSHGAEAAPQMHKAVEVPPEVVRRRTVTIAA